MVGVVVKKIKLSEIKLNPDNPRQISEKDMARLVKSLQDFPEMMQLREIVVDETSAPWKVVTFENQGVLAGNSVVAPGGGT